VLQTMKTQPNRVRTYFPPVKQPRAGELMWDPVQPPPVDITREQIRALLEKIPLSAPAKTLQAQGVFPSLCFSWALTGHMLPSRCPSVCCRHDGCPLSCMASMMVRLLCAATVLDNTTRPAAAGIEQTEEKAGLVAPQEETSPVELTFLIVSGFV
jgi:hypothetical protein